MLLETALLEAGYFAFIETNVLWHLRPFGYPEGELYLDWASVMKQLPVLPTEFALKGEESKWIWKLLAKWQNLDSYISKNKRYWLIPKERYNTIDEQILIVT